MRFFSVSALVLILVGSATFLSATAPTPEIDPATGSNAVALVAGALLVIRGRKR
jgi:hypothetical protein